MKTVLALAMSIVLAACAPQSSVPFQPVTEETLAGQIIGKKLFYKGGFMTIGANGTVAGSFRGGFKGTWEWVDGYWCRETPGLDPTNDCQLFEISGKQVRATRDKGNGRSFVYEIRG